MTGQTRFGIGVRAILFAAFVLWLTQLAGSLSDIRDDVGRNLLLYTEKQSEAWVVQTFVSGESERGGLRIGDRIVQIGDRPGLPNTFIDFRHALVYASGQVQVDRSGSLVTVDYPLPAFQFPVAAVLKDFLYGIFAIILLVFAPASRQSFLTSIMFLSWTALGQGAPFGSIEQGHFWLVLVNCIFQFVLYPVAINVWLVTAFPSISNRRLGFAWLFGIIGLVLFTVYSGDGLTPPAQIYVYFALIGLWQATLIGIVIWSYPKVQGRRRKQLSWIGTSVFVSLGFAAVTMIAATYLDDVLVSFITAEFTTLIVAIGILIAILNADFADVDKAIVLSATYAMLAIAAALIFEFLIEPMAGLLALHFGLSESAGQISMMVLVVIVSPFFKRKLQPFTAKYLQSKTVPHGSDSETQ
jgi:hypothetical protein